MKKKIIILVLSLLLLSLTGCGKDDEVTEKTDTSEIVTEVGETEADNTEDAGGTDMVTPSDEEQKAEALKEEERKNMLLGLATEAPDVQNSTSGTTGSSSNASKATTAPLATAKPVGTDAKATTAPKENTSGGSGTGSVTTATQKPGTQSNTFGTTGSSSNTSKATTAPAATAKPVATAKPAATAKPVATEKPVATAKPVVTTAPVVTPAVAPHTCSWNSGTVTKAATCNSTGTMTYTCSVCHETKTEEIAKTSHNYITESTSASCEVAGSAYDVCTNCGAKSNTRTEGTALGHDYEKVYVMSDGPTCGCSAHYNMICTRCGALGDVGEDEALGHSPDGGTVTREGNCRDEEIVTYYCTRCGSECGHDMYTTDDHNWVEGTYEEWSEELLTVVTKTETYCSRCNARP